VIELYSLPYLKQRLQLSEFITPYRMCINLAVQLIGYSQKETIIDQQQHSCEPLICERHQTILRFLSTAATASIRWRVRELYCQTTYVLRVFLVHVSESDSCGQDVRLADQVLLIIFSLTMLSTSHFV
jgi:hypothetical protein